MEPISYKTLEAMLRDPDIPDARIRPYLTAAPRIGRPFDPQVVPDPLLVRLEDDDRFRVESAIRWGNAIARWRRQRRYRLRRERGERLPVLVSEGDSWFQFPFLIDDVVDHLDSDFLVWSLDAAGDTAQNMVVARPEYLDALRARRGDDVGAFLFSAAGNDVIGEDETGAPVLSALLKPHRPGEGPAWHVDQARLAVVLQFLERCYRKVVTSIRNEAGFAKLPIVLHAYDYAIPGGGRGDPRRPSWAAPDEWLGAPLRAKGINDVDKQKAIIRILIDAVYDMLFKIAGVSAETRIFVCDVRGTLPTVSVWADEIHATDAGFALVAERFRGTLRAAGVG